MIYAYACTCTKGEILRDLPMNADHENEHCDNCGKKLSRVFTNNISVSPYFNSCTASSFAPRTAEEKARWDADGCTLMKSEHLAVGNEQLEKAKRAVGG